jgi:type I restriction enzyme M protein
MSSQSTFASAKNKFDYLHKNSKTTKCIVPVNGKTCKDAVIQDVNGKCNEEYYKWQFVYALINSGLYARDFLGVEIQFPKGNNAVLRLDGAIFDSKDWLWSGSTITCSPSLSSRRPTKRLRGFSAVK